MPYVWGDESPRSSTSVRQTLHEQFTFPTYLWIDAVCIDQNNIEERGQQVSLMFEIYTKASVVIAWLGGEDEYTVPALRLLYGLSGLWDWWSDDAKAAIRHLAHNEEFKKLADDNKLQRGCPSFEGPDNGL
ncbi:heterokaryon incompatibility protein-domain-containing protein [Rhexocercosporidium sp. MPI-PUGE-AT-0058]|nr:heterokaryon incompatibility protein-domain-containing protein [Rhexocercosporidium sp. MPI-PUGE-AT-0058]